MGENDFLLSVVVPCHNEAANIVEFMAACRAALQGHRVEYLFVDDGSTDGTRALLERLHREDPQVKPVILSRNFGHQQALKAGLDHAAGDCVVSLDGDLQHPPALIPRLIQEWQAGHEVVYTVRRDRRTPFIKRATSRLFYAMARRLAAVDIRPGTADFRLLDRAVVEVLRGCGEQHLFMRGMVVWAGFNQKAVEYEPAPRHAGRSSYSVRKMAGLALAGITSFSIRPLRIATVLGLCIATLAALYGCYVLYAFLFTDRVVAGWTSTTASVLLIGGIQLVMLGVLGEYVGKSFIEVKKRPGYIIRKKYTDR
ncbi:MAG: glycosyltransferase [Flavobacteriales bacterium]|nr:glycosyltransferase [Flavobacteriales bacterium]MEB2340998.1 glycosyltransferase [Flavobacteriia bacterium]